jgi:hypothetical protein
VEPSATTVKGVATLVLVDGVALAIYQKSSASETVGKATYGVTQKRGVIPIAI